MRRPSLFRWVLGLTLVLAASALQAGKTPAEHLAAGESALAEGKYRQAISALERAAATEHLRSRALQGLARAQFERGWPEKALKTAGSAIEAAEPGIDRAMALNTRGVLRMRHAMRSARPVTNPKQAGAVFDAGFEGFEAAATDFEAALGEAATGVPEVVLNLATAYGRLSRFRDAGEALARYRALAPAADDAADLASLLDCLKEGLGELPNLAGLRAREDVEGPRRVAGEGFSLQPVSGRRTAVAIFQGVVDRDGRLHCAWPLWNDGYTPESVGQTLLDLSRWSFEPATLGGEPVIYPLVMTMSLDRPGGR